MSQTTPNLSFLPEELLLDGGCGTFLIARGLDVKTESTAMWNCSHKEEVRALHTGFVEAGVGAIQTNTFAGNSIALASRGISDVRSCNLAGVELAQEAARATEGVLVIGNIGPTGLTPPPQGDANLFELEDCFAQQSAILLEGGVDFLHVETMAHPKEMRAALRGIQMGAAKLPVVISMSCKQAGDTYKTTLGFSVDSMLAVAREEVVHGVGANCMLAPMEMVGLIRYMVERTELPIFAKPTAAPDGIAPLYPDEFSDGVASLFKAGARAVGGCCGTSTRDMDCAVRRMKRGYT